MKVFNIWFLLMGYLFITNATAAHFAIETAPEIALPKDFKASELCSVAEKTHQYINEHKSDDFAVHTGAIINPSIQLDQIKKTLAFICTTYREDVRNKSQSRLHNPQFIKQHFQFIRWLPDKTSANNLADNSANETKSRLLNNIPDDEIFLTKYYTKLLEGSAISTEMYNQALYSLPFDEQGQTLEKAEENRDLLTRYKYTRQQIINGVLLDKKLAKPLVWITQEALHDVLLQGTGVLKVDGVTRYFNVHRNNGIDYDYTLGKREQARYWYFAEVPSIMGYGKTLASKIAIKPHVTFAGNVADLGLGKLIMVSYKQNGQPISRLGILADQGGAFDDNLFQLDMLVDSFYGWKDYHQANKHLPDYAQAWILIVK